MADCRRCQDDLKAYCDRELPWPRRLRVRRHLDQCAACHLEVFEMTQIAENLRAAEQTQAPLDASLRAKLLAAAPPPDPPRRTKRLLSAPIPGWQIAAAGVIVLLALAVLSPAFDQNREKARSVTYFQSVAMMAQQKAAQMPPAAAPLERIVSAQAHEDFSWNSLPLTTRQVHNDASIGVQVDDPEAKSDQVAQMVKEAGGYVADNTLTTGSDGSRSADLTLSVPVVQFDAVLTQIGKLGEVQSKNVTGQDITGQTSDAQQAEGVLAGEASEAQDRLVKLGKDTNWEATETARELTIQLAQARARLVLLRRMGQFSTINVTLTQKPPPAPPVQSGFLSSLRGTTRGATQSLLASVGTALSLLIWTLAYAPIWLPLALLGRFLSRRYWSQLRETSEPPLTR